MPDPRDPTPVKAVLRGGRWVVVDADGKRLPDSGEFGDEARASSAASQINGAWRRARSGRRAKGAPEVTKG